MKMSTDIPPSITTPDKVETRIGTLKVFDGFPDKATVEKVYDNLDFQRGVQAYLAALPAVSIEAFRRSYTKFGSVNQTVLISEKLLDSKSLFLTANTTTPYTVLYHICTKMIPAAWLSSIKYLKYCAGIEYAVIFLREGLDQLVLCSASHFADPSPCHRCRGIQRN